MGSYAWLFSAGILLGIVMSLALGLEKDNKRELNMY